MVFSLRIGDEEIKEIVYAARTRGMTISDYIRQSALSAAHKDNAEDTGNPAAGLQELRRQVNILAGMISRMEESLDRETAADDAR